MRAWLLGSGIAGGLPAWNDGSETALRARTRDADVPRRRGLCLAISADGLRHTIVEAPFHLASTCAGEPRLAPAAGSRGVPVDGLIVTCGDLEACAGALAVRSGLAFRLASPVGLRDALVEGDRAFASLAPLWNGLGWDRPFALDREEHLEARFFPLPGPTPDHLQPFSAEAGRARCGVRITDQRSGKRLVWAPRIQRLDSATLAELREADLRFVDGTCYAMDEGRRIRPGARTAVDLGHAPIDGREGSLARLAGMQGRSIYVGVAAANPLATRNTKEHERLAQAGVELGFDGMEITL